MYFWVCLKVKPHAYNLVVSYAQPNWNWRYILRHDNSPYLRIVRDNSSSSTRHRPNVALMLGHRLRRWPRINPTLCQRLVFDVFQCCVKGSQFFTKTLKQRHLNIAINLLENNHCMSYIAWSVGQPKHHYVVLDWATTLIELRKLPVTLMWLRRWTNIKPTMTQRNVFKGFSMFFINV